MCKTVTLFKEIVNKYHPSFSGKEKLEEVIRFPKIYNIEHLIELTMAYVGNYEFTDRAHFDFSDGSECKTASIAYNPTAPGRNTYKVEISNMVSPGGTQKSGNIRVVVYNPHGKSVKYYFIPNNMIHSLNINYHPTTNVGRVVATWNSIKDSIQKLDVYEVKTFEELANA